MLLQAATKAAVPSARSARWGRARVSGGDLCRRQKRRPSCGCPVDTSRSEATTEAGAENGRREGSPQGLTEGVDRPGADGVEIQLIRDRRYKERPEKKTGDHTGSPLRDKAGTLSLRGSHLPATRRVERVPWPLALCPLH